MTSGAASGAREKVCKMFFEEKKRCEDIAKELGVRIETVYYHIRKEREKMRKNNDERKKDEPSYHRKHAVTLEGLIDRAMCLYEASWESFEISKGIVEKQTVLKDGERFIVYVCKPNGKLVGDSRFLEICTKINAQLYVFYSGGYSPSVANGTQTPDLFSRSDEILRQFLTEQKMIKVSTEVVKSEALKGLELKDAGSNELRDSASDAAQLKHNKHDTNADGEIHN